MPVAVIVLAAGQGTRMNSDLPKVLHPLAGAPLLAHALATARALDPERTILVTGHGAEAVAAAARAIDPELRVVEQREQLGTAHAVRQALPELAGFAGEVVVLYGDTPLIRPATLEAMLAARAGGAAVVVLGFEAADPGGYGRLVLDAAGGLAAIVEAREATPAELAIRLCNSGLLAADAATLGELLASVGNDNAKGEYYLTDVVALARARGLTAAAITCPEAETLGVNSRADLAAAEAAFQARARAEAMANGATLTDPASVFFALDTVIGRDVSHRPERRLRPRGHRRIRRHHPRLLPPRGLPHQPRRPHRPLRPPAPRRRDRRGRAHRQLRRGQERHRRGRRQGQPPHLHRRRAGGPRRQHRRRHHHLQLRRRLQAPDRRSAPAPSSARTPRSSPRSASAPGRSSPPARSSPPTSPTGRSPSRAGGRRPSPRSDNG